MENEIPKILVYQRVRNRIIELFELYISREDQIEYQSKAPVNVFYELFEQWDDWVPEGDIRIHFSPPVFTEEELKEIESFDNFIDKLFDQLPDGLESLNDFHQIHESDVLADRASQALSVLLKRGRFSEDEIEKGFTEQQFGDGRS